MFRVVILSRDAGNLVPCVQAILASEPELDPRDIIVVDDGARELAEPQLPGLTWVEGAKPFIFARNANLGIRAAGLADVILHNDDALLRSFQGFSILDLVGREHPEYGVIAAVTNVTGQFLQQPMKVGLREVEHCAFVSVLIPRATIDRLGGLDERYCRDYGAEDRDYCRACRAAGLKVGVYDFCYVDHGSLRSSFRGDPRQPRSFSGNLALYHEKWGPA